MADSKNDMCDTNLLPNYYTKYIFKVLYLSIYIFWWGISNIRYLKILNIKGVANIQKTHVAQN